MVAFIHDVPERFLWAILKGNCHAVWLAGAVRGGGEQFTISICRGCDKYETIPATFEITEIVPESLAGFIKFYWNDAGFTSKQAAVDYYYEAGFSDFYTLDGFVYVFRRME